MVQLTRADIINGKSQIVDVYIPLLDEEISLRPLTDGEYSHITGLKKDMGKIKAKAQIDGTGNIDIDKTIETRKEQLAKDMEVELDMRKMQEQTYYADRLTASYGLSHGDVKISPEDLKQMRPAGVVKEIADAVMKISKLKDPGGLIQDVESFRGAEQ